MINKKIYFKEVEELFNNNKNQNLEKADFEILYMALIGKNKEVDLGYLADKIVKSLSADIFNKVMVSWDFLQTEIGRALIKAKFEMSNNIYFISDLAEILECSKQNISKDVNNEKIEYEKRKGIVYFRESAVNDYLAYKGKLEAIERKKEYVYEELKEEVIGGGYEREAEYK